MKPRPLLAILLLLSGCGLTADEPAEPAAIEALQLPGVRNAHRLGPLVVAGAAGPEGLQALRDLGVQVVINCRMPAEMDFDEQAVVEGMGLRYVSLPFVPASLDDELVQRFLAELEVAGGQAYVHCASANRVSALSAMHEIAAFGLPPEQALERARQTGLKTPALFDFVRAWAARRADTP